MHATTLKDPEQRQALPERHEPYWGILEYCRHLGLEKREGRPSYWVARLRKLDGGYKQKRLGLAGQAIGALSYDAALAAARNWFASPEILAIASRPYQVGSTQALRYASRECDFTVGDALIDYVEWKRLAATPKTFDVLLSLINYHIVPRLAHVPLDDLTAHRMTKFCRDVLETPPKRGNQALRPRTALADIDPDALRRRKATVNTLIGIVRLAVRMAWENGHTDSERAWRCIRRLPNQEAPRQVFLTRLQCRALLASCRPDLANLARAALYSGCRIAELSELRRREVGRDIFGIRVATSKGRRSRYVYLPEEGMRFFLSMTSDSAESDRVFQTKSGKPWDGRHKHLFRAAVREAGLPEGFVFHGLRHTYASQLVQAGMPLAFVARQLGHRNTDTVSRTYGHLSSASMERELERHFAPLEPWTDDLTDLSFLRRSLQAEEPAQSTSSWPRRNYARFDGSILDELKGR